MGPGEECSQEIADQFFTELRPELIKIAKNPEDATELIREILKSQ